ncbi:MAG TPA: hypothetical protein VFU89_07890 [Rhabdochlamydiaceae bacterium]|nr:hypothetical protein [Rhabdochlamydiaceae bacterium]
MKIKCIKNQMKDLPEEVLKRYGLTADWPFLIIEKKYVVYAITEFDNNIWYCVCEGGPKSDPKWAPSPLFEITDGRLSRYWIFTFREAENRLIPYISFPEMANTPSFYDELIDGDSEDNIAIFRNYKELIDLEFPDTAISEKAQIGDQDWLICPICIDGWECSNAVDGMVKCPKCQKVMHNPRYQTEKGSCTRSRRVGGHFP